MNVFKKPYILKEDYEHVIHTLHSDSELRKKLIDSLIICESLHSMRQHLHRGILIAVKEWEAESIEASSRFIYIDNLRYPSILKDISHVDVKNVETIILADNQICNLEGFNRIEAPNLQNISLSKNFLTKATIFSST